MTPRDAVDGPGEPPELGADAGERLKEAGAGRRDLVDLRSDTVTRPTPAMRRAMAGAPVGDDVLDGDPTTREVEERVADLLGAETALFFPSGTQANQTALQLHCPPGTEAVCESEAHLVHYELAAAAALGGIQLRPVPSDGGRVSGDEYEAAIRPGDRYHPETALLCLENTHNLHGGVVLPTESSREVRRVADRHGLSVHLDGARLWNASAATGVALSEYAAGADTVMISLSKGLGCPVGAVLAGTAPAMERAWTIRKRLGGGMRQSGVLAAAGLHALESHRERLADDHRRARELAAGCAEIPGLEAPEPDTNIVMIRVAPETPETEPASGGAPPTSGEAGETPAGILERELEERGVRMIATGPDRLRAVTHLDVDDDDIARALEALSDAVASG